MVEGGIKRDRVSLVEPLGFSHSDRWPLTPVMKATAAGGRRIATVDHRSRCQGQSSVRRRSELLKVASAIRLC